MWRKVFSIRTFESQRTCLLFQEIRNYFPSSFLIYRTKEKGWSDFVMWNFFFNCIAQNVLFHAKSKWVCEMGPVFFGLLKWLFLLPVFDSMLCVKFKLQIFQPLLFFISFRMTRTICYAKRHFKIKTLGKPIALISHYWILVRWFDFIAYDLDERPSIIMKCSCSSKSSIRHSQFDCLFW